MPEAAAPITIVVPVYRGAVDVARCLDSLRRHLAPMLRPMASPSDLSPCW